MNISIITITLGGFCFFSTFFDLAYELTPRRGQGTGPLTRWLRRHNLLKGMIQTPLLFGTVLATGVLLAVVPSHSPKPILVAWFGYFGPLLVYDVIDWIGENDRPKRLKKRASDLVKALLKRLKPAPAPQFGGA